MSYINSEWQYLTDKALQLVASLVKEGMDPELAYEVAIAKLGDKEAFALEE